jgi:hypothetical protein
MRFSSDNYEDIQRYYRSTYVKFQECGERLFYIRDVHHEIVRGTDEDGTEFELYLNHDDPYEVDYVLPNKSYFQFAKRACMLQRIPAKQYRRGICTENVRLTALTKTGGLSNVELSFASLKAFVSKQAFPSIKTVLTMKNKPLSVAISPRFAFVPETGDIFADQLRVAVVNKKEQKITILQPVFRKEVEALVEGIQMEMIHG